MQAGRAVHKRGKVGHERPQFGKDCALSASTPLASADTKSAWPACGAEPLIQRCLRRQTHIFYFGFLMFGAGLDTGRGRG